MSYVKGKKREEYQMVCLEELIEEDDKARLIDVIVNTLKPKELGYTENERKNGSGRPRYDVYTMTKLYLLGYQNGIRSGRKLEAACKYDTRFKWLLEGREPDANTINDFRKENIEYLKKVFYEVNRIYMKVEILTIKNVSQDGFKIKASNSKEKNYTMNKIIERIKRDKKGIELTKKEKERLEKENTETRKYLTELEKNEEIEELEERIKELESRIEGHEKIIKEMEEEGTSQISQTDKESKLMRNNGKYEVCYNNQTAVDMETHLTVAYETDSNPADVGSMSSLMEEIKREYEIEEEIITNTTDAGYKSRKDMMECLEKGVVPQVTPGRKDNKEEIELETEYEEAEITEEIRKSKKREDIKKCIRSGIIPECYEGIIKEIKVEEVKENEGEIEEEEETRRSEEIREEAIENKTFERDKKLNVVYCPEGEVLSQKSKKGNGKIRYANKKACKYCKNPCCKGEYKEVDFKEGQKRVIPKSKGEGARGKRREKTSKKKVRLKLKIDEKYIEKRMQTSEHSQGTMKTVDNHRDFHMRGKAKVRGEIAIYFTASNIRRVSNMVGVKEMIEKIERYFTKLKNNSIILNIKKNRRTKTMKEIISFEETNQLMVRLGGVRDK